MMLPTLFLLNSIVALLHFYLDNGFFSGFSTAVAIALLLGILDHLKCRDEC